MTTEAPERTALVAQGAPNDTFALAVMSDQDFDRRLSALKQGRSRVQQIQREIMVEDVDYGTIPGTPKPTLYKSGAETLCVFHGLVARMEVEYIAGDGFGAPHLTYNAECYLHLGSTDGPIVGTGHGTANSWERRYRYRRGERTCPSCGLMGTIIKGKAEYGGGWLCWRRKNGCGTTFPDGDESIEGQNVGDVENPDPFDLAVTLMKMAEKRAHVDATLRATGTSGLFTQDVEDGAPAVDEKPSGCAHASTEARDEGVVCLDCGSVLAQRGAGTGAPRNIGEAKGRLAAVLAEHGMTFQQAEAKAKELGIDRGSASVDDIMRLIAAIEHPGHGEPAPEPPPAGVPSSSVDGEPEPARDSGSPTTPTSDQPVSDAATAAAPESPQESAADTDPNDLLDDILDVTNGELVPPKPGTKEYKALPSGVERAAAKSYWEEKPVEPEGRPDAEQLRAMADA